MGLGQMLAWSQDGSPNYFSTTEKEIGKEDQSTSMRNVIELSVSSKPNARNQIDFVKIDVGFMNPKDKNFAKNLYFEKVKVLTKILDLPLPENVLKSLKGEKNETIEIGKYKYLIEYYGDSRKWISLKIS